MQTFYIGYVPKDLAYNLSVLLEYPSVLKAENFIYSTVGKQTFIEVSMQL